MASDDAPAPHTAASPAKAMSGPEVIADLVKRLPNGPGVYRMIDAKGTVLYVGKARSLKKRVQSYTRVAGQSGRIARVIQATAAMEFVSTRTETEALLLEANLIKRLRPRFNVLLRDDKSFPYILITGDHPAPQIVKHRGARSRKGTYFGPFASAGAVGRTINALQRAFLLRTCSDAFYESRTRPCLLYQIKRCSAPCTGEISLDDYAELVDEAKAFLSGKSQAVRAEIATVDGGGLGAARFRGRGRLSRPPRRALAYRRRTRASTRAASRKPTSSPATRTAARPASRSSSSAPARTGATAPISRAPTRASIPEPCSAPSSRSSTTTSRRRG